LLPPPPPSPSLPPPPPSAMGTLSLTVLIASAHSPHASAWSITCVSIVQRLVNQCLEHQHTTEIIASTNLAHSLIAWAYSVTCASMTADITAMPTTPKLHTQHLLQPFLPLLPPPIP
uniref:Mediator of RNA polymerase II transcription subunit 33A n=1 Tax=Schistocephalus solidus TaxID=70667 RepID=A0A183SBH6_SCHSO